MFPGFEEAGGLEGTGLDFLANPDGDPEVSAEYFKKAGMSSGKCEGSDCEITMVGDDSPPGSDTAEVFKSQLEEMGFKVNFQKVTHDIMYTKFCSVPSNAPEVCPNVGWLKDFNDGLRDADALARLLRGLPAKVNLIPTNPDPVLGERMVPPAAAAIEAFHQRLLDRNLTTTVRRRRGDDVSAACGQLRAHHRAPRGFRRSNLSL